MAQFSPKSAQSDRSGSDQADTKNSLMIPIAIIIGFGFISLAIFFQGSNSSAGTLPNLSERPPAFQNQPVRAEEIRPITAEDNIRGNPNAPIVILEYSDYDCPFCKHFHETMNLIMENYGPTGQVAWVYRHNPIEQLHPSATFVAMSAECVAEVGGNEAFWTFSDLVFNERGRAEPTNLTRLHEFAERAGADRRLYQECVDSERTLERVRADISDAQKAGAIGSPHSLLIVGDQIAQIPGSESFATLSIMIENLLEQLDITIES